MKLITKFKSKNFDNRGYNKISCIIIHYTALDNSNLAIKYLLDKSNKVSSHYLISNTGEIFYLVNNNKRAWHAGKSFWKGNKDINSISIGIELDFNPKKNKYYSNKLIQSLIKLISNLKKKYNINSQNILGHSDISPFRKIDPGPTFPWKKLHLKKIVILPKKISVSDLIKVNNILKNKIKGSIKYKALYMLKQIGYDVLPAKKSNKKYNLLIKAYQMRYVKVKRFGKLNYITYFVIKSHFNQLLTHKHF